MVDTKTAQGLLLFASLAITDTEVSFIAAVNRSASSILCHFSRLLKISVQFIVCSFSFMGVLYYQKRGEYEMEWFIISFYNKDKYLQEVYCTEKAVSVPLYIHLSKCLNMGIEAALNIKMQETELFRFEGELFQAVTTKNCLGEGYIVFISNIFIKSKVFEEIINHIDIGIEIFDETGRLLYLNETCKRIESLIEQNVIGKHLLNIYTVDENYSTILTTLKKQNPVKNRCDIFTNRFGDTVTSINSGYPLFIENQFFGAYGIVLDTNTLSVFQEQKEILQEYLDSRKSKPPSSFHLGGYYTFDNIIGNSQKLLEAKNLAERVADSHHSVLLLGETGTGKEIFAQSLHTGSSRCKKPFVAINCAAIPSSILESILFGTVKGTFTGSSNQIGLLDEANNGTLFLDEINSMDIHVQSKLLRVLQEKNFRRVGGTKDIQCDFRIIAAMNEPLAHALENNHLRQDLYFRLSTFSIEIPPLRERLDDIPILVDYYIEKVSHNISKSNRTISKEVIKLLMDYDWPGNVRELFHALDFACIMAGDGTIKINCFPQRLQLNKNRKKDERQKTLHYCLRKHMLDYEKQILQRTLLENGFNISQTAKVLNLTRQNLQHRIKKCRIQIKKVIKST